MKYEIIMEKLKSIISYILNEISWVVMVILSFIFLSPLYSSNFKDFLREYKSIWAFKFLWFFINDGNNFEEFKIAGLNIAPDWFLKEKGGFDYKEKLTKWQKFYFKLRWTIRNPADNWLNNVIGKDSTSPIYLDGSRVWYYQSKKLYFRKEFYFLGFHFVFGSNQYRYILRIKLK